MLLAQAATLVNMAQEIAPEPADTRAIDALLKGIEFQLRNDLEAAKASVAQSQNTGKALFEAAIHDSQTQWDRTVAEAQEGQRADEQEFAARTASRQSAEECSREASLQSMVSLIDMGDWIEDNEQTWEEYFTDAGKLTFIGDYAEVEPNAAGVVGSVLFGMTGLDFYKDIADIVYGFHHWEWSVGHVANQALNFVALVPVIGAVKNLKHVDELAAAVKTASRLSDGAKTANRVCDGAKVAGKSLDEVASIGKNSPVSVRRYLQNIRDYWKLAGGVTQGEAAAIAKSEGFGFEIGRVSRFENARNSVVIGKPSLRNGLVNRLELAEEIQHGLDRARHAASRAIRRGLSNEEFHAELFERIISGHRAGGYQFLTSGDIKALEDAIRELRRI